jgi:TolA-binding protein
MEVYNAISPDNFFVDSLQMQSRLETLSNQALNAGIDKYMKKDYKGAALEFQKSINLLPTSDYVPDATKYLSQTYLKLEQTDKAIEAYKKGIELNRDRDDLLLDLGNLYYAEDRYDEALTQYKEAVRINPTLSTNHYSLGQAYLKLEKYSEAETEFRTVVRMEPDSAYGHYGLGLTFSKYEKYDKAIENFEMAVRKDEEFYDAYAEIGYAYADKGEMAEAQEMVEFLEDKDKSLAQTLSLYMNKVEPPKILYQWGTGTFVSKMSVNTPLSSLDSYLENAGAEKSLTMKFQFNKEMDRSSVENPFNWSIKRSDSANPWEAYNFGQSVPDTEITLPPFPDYVIYNAKEMTATLAFTVSQNETADGTIDPSHIVFKFDGKDAEGIAMDANYDEYSGFTGIA